MESFSCCCLLNDGGSSQFSHCNKWGTVWGYHLSEWSQQNEFAKETEEFIQKEFDELDKEIDEIKPCEVNIGDKSLPLK